MPIRLIAASLIMAVAFAPALNEVRASWQASASQDQDPWEDQTPKELEGDAFEKGVSHAPLNAVCLLGEPSEVCLLSEDLTLAHFLESSLYVLRHLRI